MTTCTRCILTSNFPGIAFDEQGVCNFCRSYKPETASEEVKRKYEEKFLELVREHRNHSGYDVLMAYSGGKDSTYTLDIFVNRYGLKVLALTFDNTFISERSFVNMRNVTDALGVDHMIIRPSPKTLRTIFRAAAGQELYSSKAMERASTICTSCIGLVKAVMLRTALEKKIPFVGFGWSPGQAPIQASVMHTNPGLTRATQKTITEPLQNVVGSADTLIQYFVTDQQFEHPECFPWNIHPLAFLEYNEEKMVEHNRTARVGETTGYGPEFHKLHAERLCKRCPCQTVRFSPVCLGDRQYGQGWCHDTRRRGWRSSRVARTMIWSNMPGIGWEIGRIQAEQILFYFMCKYCDEVDRIGR